MCLYVRRSSPGSQTAHLVLDEEFPNKGFAETAILLA
jgi:hypothetical protein